MPVSAPTARATSHQRASPNSKKGDASDTNAKQAPCHTCRRQRLKCDAAKPNCQKCAARGVECLGYGAQPFLWVQPRPPKQTRPAKDTLPSGGSPAQPKVLGKKKGRPKLVLMSRHITADSEDDHQHPVFNSGKQQLQCGPKWVLVNSANGRRRSKGVDDNIRAVIPTGLAPVGYHDSHLALSLLDYYNKHIVPDMVLIDSELNPHRADLKYWRYFPDILIDMIISGALTHQLLRCHATQDSFPLAGADPGNQVVAVSRNRMSSLSNPSLVSIYKHQQATLKALNDALSEPELKYSDIVLGTVIALMRVEIQQSAFGPWPTHLHAARTIINRRGGFKKLVEDDEALMVTGLTNFMLIDIMSAVFTAGTSLNRQTTVSQLEYIPLLEAIFKNGRDYDFPCANQLVESIIRINHVRAISQDVLTAPPGLDTSCAQILYRIATFDPVFSSQSLIRELLSSSPTMMPSSSSASSATLSDDESGTCQSGSSRSTQPENAQLPLYSMCEDLARAFQYAVMLYCLRTLYIDMGRSVTQAFSSPLARALLSEGTTIIDVTRPHESALEGLLEVLHRLWAAESKDSAWVNKLTLWPLWVAGMEIDLSPDTADERQFICKSLQKLCYHLGCVSPLDGVSALQLIWARTAHVGGFGQQATWDERVAMPGMPGLFFI